MGWSPRRLPTPCYHFTALPEFSQLVCKTQKWSHSQSPPLVKVQGEKRNTNPAIVPSLYPQPIIVLLSIVIIFSQPLSFSAPQTLGSGGSWGWKQNYPDPEAQGALTALRNSTLEGRTVADTACYTGRYLWNAVFYLEKIYKPGAKGSRSSKSLKQELVGLVFVVLAWLSRRTHIPRAPKTQCFLSGGRDLYIFLPSFSESTPHSRVPLR